MSRRFSDEPINLIHRIPTPEQLSAARPSKRSFGQVIMESGAACVRGLSEVLARVARVGRGTQPSTPAQTTCQGSVTDLRSRPANETAGRSQEGLLNVVRPQPPLVEPLEMKSAAGHAAVQPEEVAELRAFVLSQQQDIAGLSAQIQELKSLVVSQQQVLVYLGKELEASSLSLPAGVASAPAKRNRAVREKPAMKDKAVARKDAPSPSSLSY